MSHCCPGFDSSIVSERGSAARRLHHIHLRPRRHTRLHDGRRRAEHVGWRVGRRDRGRSRRRGWQHDACDGRRSRAGTGFRPMADRDDDAPRWWCVVSRVAWVLSLYRVARFEDGGIRLMSSTATRHGRQPEWQSRSIGFRQGFAVNLLNPAIATFYLVVVPIFLPPGSTRWYFAGLAAIHITMAFGCHSLWAVGLDRLQRLFRPPVARRLLEALTGVALLGLAVRVLLG